MQKSKNLKNIIAIKIKNIICFFCFPITFNYLKMIFPKTLTFFEKISV